MTKTLIKLLSGLFVLNFFQPVYGYCDTSPTGGNNPSASENYLTRTPIVTDPQAWLERPMSCQELKEQISVRYSPFKGKISALPDEKKLELAHVLKVACSDRFKGCGFSCDKKDQALRAQSEEPGAADSDVAEEVLPSKKILSVKELRQKAEDELHLTFKAVQADKEQVIAKRIAEENRNGISWQPFVMPNEPLSYRPSDTQSSNSSTSQFRPQNNTSPYSPTKRRRRTYGSAGSAPSGYQGN